MVGLGTFLKEYLEFEGKTQSQFAKQLGITQKHMNLILNNKSDISTDLMYAIYKLTNIDINFIANIEHKRKVIEDLTKTYEDEETIKKYLKKFNINELRKRGWLKFKDTTNIYQNAVDLLEFLKYRNFSALNKDDDILYKKTKEKKELAALWIARCDELVIDQVLEEYDKSNISNIISSINEHVFNENNIDESYIKTLMNNNGIYFVIEKGLSTSGIRGAFKIYKGKPAVYISTFQNRVDGLVYSLFHELSHVKSDYNQGKSKVILDGTEAQEKRADEFAYTSMVPKEVCNDILINNDENHLLEISRIHRIPMCYMVSQLAAKINKYKYSSQLYKKYVIKLVK